MLIRSQDKMKLVKINNLQMHPIDIEPTFRNDGTELPGSYDLEGRYEIVDEFINAQGEVSYSLGIYSSKEKALKVLDNIQRNKEYQNILIKEEDANNNRKVYSHVGFAVFEMPQDDDVE